MNKLAEERSTEAKQQYLDAERLARSLGLDYHTPSVWATASIEDVLARIETVVAHGLINNAPMRKAALGAIEKPPIQLSQHYDEYEITQKLALSKMSPDQIRKWKAAKKRAVEILVEQWGDKALHQLPRGDALAFADWWEECVINEGIGAGTSMVTRGFCRPTRRSAPPIGMLRSPATSCAITDARTDNPFGRSFCGSPKLG